MRYLPSPSECHYLPDRLWRLEYVLVTRINKVEFGELVERGWRRFGDMLFRPSCPGCTACRPIRVIVDSFRLDRNQRRVQKLNSETKLVIGKPVIDEERTNLYYRHHAHHAEQKGWPFPDMGEGMQHINRMINGPLPILEFAYYRDDKLVAVSYIDEVAEGYSGIYFYHDPEYRKLSLGTWICISLIEEAARQQMPYVYLGYYIEGCRSMEYKGKFLPNQVLNSEGVWEDFL